MNWKKTLERINPLIVSFILAGVLIGVLVMAQFQSSVASNSYVIDEVNAQKELLTSFDEDRTNLKNTIANLKQKIEENRNNLEKNGNEVTLDTLQELKSKAGLTKEKGKGVRIILGEGASSKSNNDAHVIHAADLRDLVNVIKTARVDGISINGQRIIANSTITSLGSTIMVDKSKVAAPFEINVIGSTEMIANRLSDQKSYPDLYLRIKNKDVSFDVQKLDQVILPAFDGDYLFKYAQLK